jgi:hypothetical protein
VSYGGREFPDGSHFFPLEEGALREFQIARLFFYSLLQCLSPSQIFLLCLGQALRHLVERKGQFTKFILRVHG